MEHSVYLGRQPIYGPGREIRGYELLYRRAVGDNSAQFNDGNRASAEVLLKAIIEIGLHKVSPERPVFINHTSTLLKMDPILPPDRCVIEVLEEVTADATTVQAMARLKQANYRMALDDFVYRDDLAPMVRLADYIKLDYRALGPAGFGEQLRRLRPYRKTIVAEKIESESEFRWCKSEGCAMFQGYYLRKPDLLVGRRIPSNKLSVLSLVAECTNLDNSANVIAAIIARDAPLTYGLLRLANSALYRRRSEIRTPAQAVTLLGMDFVLRWATLLAMAGNDDCPMGYLEAALQRARMCELVAGAQGSSGPEGYIIGLLSTLDSVLNAPLPDLVLPLPIDNRFKRALLEREGALGAVLDTVTAYESGQWGGSDAEGSGGAGDAAIQKAFWDATEYARSMLGAFMRGGALEADRPDGHGPGEPAPGGAARGLQPERR